MSGPKISDYILHPWRVAEIRAEWERQCAEWREEEKKLELEEQASLVKQYKPPSGAWET